MLTFTILGFTFAILCVIFAYRAGTKNSDNVLYYVTLTILSSMIGLICGLWLMLA